MQEPELNFEADISDHINDPNSAQALDNFFKSLNIKSANDIPAFKVASLKSKNILKKYCTEKNHRNRANKIINFYKCIDWIPFEELDTGILNNFSSEDKKALLKDIQIYLNKKEEKRNQTTNWKKEYNNRIIEYYKKNVPTKLKIQLEELRDYELNIVEHDRNWVHYFRFKSFKKIDEFLKLKPHEREEIFSNFKKDVQSYKKNRDINLFGDKTDCASCNKSWDDELLNNIKWEKNHKQDKNNHHPTSPKKDTSITDYATLELAYGTDLQTVKQQYRKLALIYHPDKPGGNEKKMKAIVNAYQRLINKH